VAIECPPPWEPCVFDSKAIPEDLRSLGEEINSDYDRYQTRFLLIHNDQLKQDNLTRVLVFRKPCGPATGYDKQEFHLNTIHAAVRLVRQVVMGEPGDAAPVELPSRDIFVCTHGSRDRCCSRFGAPIFHQGRRLVEELGLEDTRIWQASHIGGHRMAPTAIDFPSARYYGYLDGESIQAVLTHSGDIHRLEPIYRGWGVLPWAAQILEKKLLLIHGWDWLSYAVAGQVLETDEEETFCRVTLTYQPAEGNPQRYQADIVADEEHTVQLKSSCASEKLTSVTPYRVLNLTRIDLSSSALPH
jgi:hypothetical protein